MNTFNYSVRTLGFAFAALMLLALPFAMAPQAHADWEDIGDYIPFDMGGYDTGWYTDSATPYYDYADYGGYGDTGWYTDSATPYYDYADYGGYGSSYGSPMSYGMPFGGGSGFGGGFPFGGGGMPGITNVNQNQNQNTCTAGSCNTSTAINAPTTVSTIAYPQPMYQQQYQQQYQQPNYYPPQYQQPTYSAPVSYNHTPYVSLSAVPYTGLDLGPWGTAIYWGFLVLWCLGAAYLIAVKKVHYRIASWFIGSSASKTVAETRSEVRHSAPKIETKTTRVPESQLSGVDPFIASQINRAAF